MAVMMLLFSCRSQKNAADKNVDSIAIGSSPVRNIGDKPEGADRSLIDSENGLPERWCISSPTTGCI